MPAPQPASSAPRRRDYTRRQRYTLLALAVVLTLTTVHRLYFSGEPNRLPPGSNKVGVVIASVLLVGAVMSLMAIGVIFKGRALRGSCGGADGSCGCSPEKRARCDKPHAHDPNAPFPAARITPRAR